jgi:hypothetical protein
MLYSDTISKFIDLTKFKPNKNYIDYSVIHETDNTISIAFIQTNDNTKNTIYKDHNLLKINTPLCLKPFIGKKVIIYNDHINSSINELCRIKPIDFKFENMVGLRYKYPYFTSTTLIIPFFYINKYLDDISSILRASFVLTNELILRKNQIRVEFTITKDGELLNYPLYKTTNGLKTRMLHKFLDLIDENNKFLEKFTYFDTIDVSFNKYGVMVFQEELQ